VKSIVAIRPEPGLSATLAAGRELGLPIEGWPLFEIGPVAWQLPDPDEIDALLIGSANALRHAGPEIGAFRGKPVHAVGLATAQFAQEEGFTVASVGERGLQGVLDALAGRDLGLLRLAGAERITLAIPPAIQVTERIVYESAALPMPDGLVARLAKGAVVLMHSAAAARHFVNEVSRLSLAREGIDLAALGPRIIEAAGEGWGSAAFAASPNDKALLALAKDMCH